jgi:hypothetical protein
LLIKYCDVYPLVGNDPVNIFPLKRVTAIGRPLLGNVSVYKPRQQERISVAGNGCVFWVVRAEGLYGAKKFVCSQL